jgi:hypothetical protein
MWLVSQQSHNSTRSHYVACKDKFNNSLHGQQCLTLILPSKQSSQPTQSIPYERWANPFLLKPILQHNDDTIFFISWGI